MFGSFHLGFPGVPEENTHQTIDALTKLAPKILSPLHCTGSATVIDRPNSPMSELSTSEYSMTSNASSIHPSDAAP